MPLGNLPGMMSNIQMNPAMMSMMAPGSNPMMPPINPMNAMNQMGGMPMNFPNANKIIPPNMGPGPISGPMPGMMPQSDIKTRINQIIRDRVGFDSMEIQKAKRFLIDPIKFSLEEAGISRAESGSLASNYQFI